jgi:flavin-dependent dehydrogenase
LTEDSQVERETDVFVIGGGPAGLAAAIAARQKGFQVLVADGAAPPIEKACGEGLLPDSLSALQKLGVSISASDGYRVRGIRFLDGDSIVEADFPSGQGIGLRRISLHRRMVEKASELGVSFLWKTPVTGLNAEGVALGDEQVRAKWIIGADGSHSRIRRWSGLDVATQQKWRFAVRQHYRVKPWSDWTEVYWGPQVQAYVTPVGREEVCVALISANRGMKFIEALRGFPKLASRLNCAVASSSVRGGVTATYSLKSVHRNNVAVIGDASGSVDAITGEGLSLSFRQAQALAEALEAGNLALYQNAHRGLHQRPALMAKLMLNLAHRPGLRKRTMHALQAAPQIFTQLLSLHVGVASPRQMAITGARLGWQFLTA